MTDVKELLVVEVEEVIVVVVVKVVIEHLPSLRNIIGRFRFGAGGRRGPFCKVSNLQLLSLSVQRANGYRFHSVTVSSAYEKSFFHEAEDM